MQAQNENGVPVIIMTQPLPMNRRYYEKMNSLRAKQLIELGSMQIVLGALSVIFAVISITIAATHFLGTIAFCGYGIWIGIPFIVTGPFGVIGGKRKLRYAVLTFNVMSIISASLTVIMFCLAIPSSIIASYSVDRYSYRYSYYGPYYTTPTPPSLDAPRTALAMEALMAFIAVAEAVVAIWSAVVCCKIGACCCDCDGACCCPPPSQEPPQVMLAGQNFVGVPQQPYVMYTTSNQPQYLYPVNGQQQPLMQPDFHHEAGQDGSKYMKLNYRESE